MGFIISVMAMTLSSQDVVVNLCALQDTQAVAVDLIEIYNETNASSLQFTNLPQNVTEYAINFSGASVGTTTSIPLAELYKNSPYRLSRINQGYCVNAEMNGGENMQISLYNINGQLLHTQSYVAGRGENTFLFPVTNKGIGILQINTKGQSQSYKVGETFIGEFYKTEALTNQKSSKLKSTSAFLYNAGDRIHITVTKNNLQSRKWMGQPANNDEIRIAIPKNDRVFDMAQTLSKGAQEHTISYSGVAFYTGCFYASTFYPPGKVADYFGFQYFRDNDPDEGGHNTDFLTKAAYHTIHLLDDAQLKVLIDLAKLQDSLIYAYAYARMPVIKSFHRYLDNDIPLGKTQLNKEAVIQASKEIYLIDGELSYGRAKAFSTVIKSLTQEQKDYLYALNSIGMQLWEMPQKPDRNIPRELNTHVMTNCSEMFSWFLGSHEADTYFCPERQGTYFGGFFMKDAPAMGNSGYAIDMETTADKGSYMLNSILDETQEQQIRGIYTSIVAYLDSITAVRANISTELRKFWTQDEIDKKSILDWSEKYGEYDGNYIYTMADQFVEVARTLTSQQRDTLIWLRELEDFPCKSDTVFLYSKEIKEPVLDNTDLFFE